MMTSEYCSFGNHQLCSDKTCECGCHSELIRLPSEEIEENSALIEGVPGPE